MITLYQRTDCPFCWKVRLALAELSLPYEVVETRLGEKHPEVQRLSPVGTVPVLVEGELAIWESGVILEYLHGLRPEGDLLPGDPAAAARVRSLHAYSDKCVGPALRDLVFEKRSGPERDWNIALIADSEERWRQCQHYLEERLGQSGYFGGTAFSAADCALGARFGVAEAYGAGVGTSHPALLRWYESIKSRDSWRQAYPRNFIRHSE